MVNHPNRKKTYPNHTFADGQRELGKYVKLCWDMRGPPNTEIAWLSCVQVEKDVFIIETFKDENGYLVFKNFFEKGTNT